LVWGWIKKIVGKNLEKTLLKPWVGEKWLGKIEKSLCPKFPNRFTPDTIVDKNIKNRWLQITLLF
jgi:hypothetical protein